MRNRSVIAVLLVVGGAIAPFTPAAASSSRLEIRPTASKNLTSSLINPSPSRIAKLKRSVSIANWAQRYWGEQNFKNINYMTAQELTRMKRAGFTSVRLTVEPSVVMNQSVPSQPMNLPD